MATAVAALINTKFAETTDTDQLTPDKSENSVDKFTGTNVSGANATLTVRIVPADSTPDAKYIVKKTIAPGATYTFPELVGQILQAGDSLYTQCSNANAIVIRCSGRKFT